jgi:hypothetical protein
VYLPPGSYRITKTLVFQGPRHGCLVVGHGRDTRPVWDGPQGGRMFWSNGVAYSRYVGLSWDGRGKAAVGFEHAAQQRFETEVRHEHEAFRNFSGFGIRVGHEQQVASAEILYHNCLFENCGTALAFLTFNDYGNTIDGCEFRNCGAGVLGNKGNFYARNCHFAGSRRADFIIGSEHGSSIRRCTSFGSRRFIEEQGTIAPLTVQDCHVAAWTDPEGAVHLSGSPVLMFDCSLTRPPSDRAPVRLANPAQKLMISNNRSVVMSDFYNEQSDQHLVFEGGPGQPEGTVTIQGPKMHMFTQEPVFDIRNYAGRIYYGQSQFYTQPKEPRFVSKGTRPVRLILAGHFWYDTKPRFELGPEVKLTLMANREVSDHGVDDEAMTAIAAALDDLRRLGELDQGLSRLGL